MATTTPNIGLTLPEGTEGWKRSVINVNFTILDTKIGAVGNTSLQSQINTLSSQLTTRRSPAINSLSSDTEILNYANGAYQVSLANSSEYIPSQWGTLIIMFSNVSYGVAIYVTTAGAMYVRHKKSGSEWHSSWKAV